MSTTTFLHQRYQQLLRVGVSHLYFGAGQTGAFSLQPDALTSLHLQQARLQHRPLPGGIHILADVQAGPVQVDLSTHSWNFWLILHHPNMLSLTQLPVAGLPSKTGQVGTFTRTGSGWVTGTMPTPAGMPAEAIGLVKIQVPLDAQTATAATLELDSPLLDWHFMVLSDAAYAGTVQVVTQGQVISTALQVADWPLAFNVPAGKKAYPMRVRLRPRLHASTWYLAGTDLLPLPGTAPVSRAFQLAPQVLDYAHILK